MSYILEALKKSDQQRQRQLGATPTLADVPVSVAAQGDFRAPYYVLLAVLLAIGIVIRWLLPWLDIAVADVGTVQPTTTVRQDAQVLPSVYEKTTARPTREPFMRDTQSAKPAAAAREVAAAQTVTTARQDVQVSSLPYVGTATQPLREAFVPETQPVEPSVEAEAPVRQYSTHADVPEQVVISLNELPPAIQRELPEMAVQMHAYSSKPAERLVSINAIRLREGGSLMLGLRLEEITPDGMIFSYKGYRFRRGIR